VTLGEVIVGTGADRTHRVFDAAIGRDQHETQFRPLPAHFLQQGQAVSVGQLEVRQHQMQGRIAETRKRVAHAGGNLHRESGTAQDVAHQCLLGRIVFDQEDGLVERALAGIDLAKIGLALVSHANFLRADRGAGWPRCRAARVRSR
jgi:hypothetical protein